MYENERKIKSNNYIVELGENGVEWKNLLIKN